MKAILRFFCDDVLRYLFRYKIMGIPSWIPATIGIVLWILYEVLQSPEYKEDPTRRSIDWAQAIFLNNAPVQALNQGKKETRVPQNKIFLLKNLHSPRELLTFAAFKQT